MLKDFLIKHRAEVLDVCITEYDEEEVMTAIRNESYDIGKRDGIDIGKNQIVCVMVRKGTLNPEVAATELGITVEELEKMMNNILDE